jgi:hypothetical protein
LSVLYDFHKDHRLKPVDELCLTGMFLYPLCQWMAG